MNTSIDNSIETFNRTIRRQLIVVSVSMVVILSVFFCGYFFSSYDSSKSTSNYNENKNITETNTNGGVK